jgi:hypothetical protein
VRDDPLLPLTVGRRDGTGAPLGEGAIGDDDNDVDVDGLLFIANKAATFAALNDGVCACDGGLRGIGGGKPLLPIDTGGGIDGKPVRDDAVGDDGAPLPLLPPVDDAAAAAADMDGWEVFEEATPTVVIGRDDGVDAGDDDGVALVSTDNVDDDDVVVVVVVVHGGNEDVPLD